MTLTRRLGRSSYMAAQSGIVIFLRIKMIWTRSRSEMASPTVCVVVKQKKHRQRGVWVVDGRCWGRAAGWDVEQAGLAEVVCGGRGRGVVV